MVLVAWSGTARAQDLVPERVHVKIDVSVETEGVQPELAEVFSPTHWAVDAVISMEPVRRFRDGSIGWLLRFDTVSEAVHEAEGVTPIPTSGLEGRTVEMRTFEDGEVLDIDMGEHIAGWGRGGDVLDVLLPILSPAPPDMRWHDTARRRMIWPFRVGQDVRWDNSVNAQWTNEGPMKNLAGPVRRYHYKGPWTLKGRDRRASPVLSLVGEGEVSGTVDVTFKDRRVLSHSFDWTRTVELTTDDGRRIAQVQHFTGTTERIGQ